MEEENKPVVFHLAKIFLKDIGECEILLYEGEDPNYPHFHIVKMDTYEDYCSVCIFEADYYKSHHKLTKYQKEQLNIILTIPYAEAPFFKKKMILWNNLRGSWLIANMPDFDETIYDNILTPPDYTQLPE